MEHRRTCPRGRGRSGSCYNSKDGNIKFVGVSFELKTLLPFARLNGPELLNRADPFDSIICKGKSQKESDWITKQALPGLHGDSIPVVESAAVHRR